MKLKQVIGAGCLVLVASSAAAQDQRIIVDRPLKPCEVDNTRVTEANAAALITQVFGVAPSLTRYYLIHDTSFVERTNATTDRMVVAEENWYVYHGDWTKPKGGWLVDSRYAKHFEETRIFGSPDVALVYLYRNVPVLKLPGIAEMLADPKVLKGPSAALADRLLAVIREGRTKTEKGEDDSAREAEAKKIEDENKDAAEQKLPLITKPEAEARIAKVVADARAKRIREYAQSLKESMPSADELAVRDAFTLRKSKPAPVDDLLEVVWLETAQYLRAFERNNNTITNQAPLVERESGQKVVPLADRLATTAEFKSLATLFYEVEITKKIAAPLKNLQDAARLALTPQSALSNTLFVATERTSLCAGQVMDVKHLPSDMNVRALTKDADGKENVERSKQLFDNEGKSWWDISFALPADFRKDVTFDVDGGRAVGKSVEKADLFAALNIGPLRDTKRAQWQLVPNLVYGIPITGKPLHHHFLGLSFGLNYVQLLVGVRWDRTQQITNDDVDGVPIATESTTPEKKWKRSRIIFGLNVPVSSVVKLFKKSDAKDDKK